MATRPRARRANLLSAPYEGTDYGRTDFQVDCGLPFDAVGDGERWGGSFPGRLESRVG